MTGRPVRLFPLFAALQTLDGIGPKTAAILEGVGVEKPRDILMPLPQSGVDRQLRGSIREGPLARITRPKRAGGRTACM